MTYVITVPDDPDDDWTPPGYDPDDVDDSPVEHTHAEHEGLPDTAGTIRIVPDD